MLNNGTRQYVQDTYTKAIPVLEEPTELWIGFC